ncbi:MAG TPA: hypothetical protein VHQ22_20480 [Terriglobales bacterium]|nr:hypothetical protein [Terriglobales bacterium]
MRKQTHRSRQLAFHDQQRERAAAAARHIPWPVLSATRNQYLEWQEFYHWARSIMESEECIPDWLARRLDEMCPGFLSREKRLAKTSKEAAQVPVRLGQWIDEHIFGFAQQAGWLPAITYYAVREPRYQRASVCWSETVKEWRKAKPAEYPSLEQWVAQAARCNDTKRLLPRIRKEREGFRRVEPSRLQQAVARYIEWEALAYWARAAFEHSRPVLNQVARELDARCPGFLGLAAREDHQSRRMPLDWAYLMVWIRDHFFRDAKAEGWYDAVVLTARMHPRAIRTMEYADHCDEVWNGGLPEPFPSFEAWRRDADRYVDVTST